MMCIRDESKAIAMTPLFQGMDLPKLRKLAFASDRVTFAPGETIIKQGDDSAKGYVIMCGTADRTVETKTGAIDSLGSVGAGYLVGEAAMLAGIPYLITVEAETEVEALCMRKDYVLKMLEGDTETTSMALQVLSKRIAQIEANHSAAAPA